MKSDFLKILANKKELKDKKLYNELLTEYGKVADARQVYHYQLGYTPNKLQNLRYEVMKKMSITEKEIMLYTPEAEIEEENLDSSAKVAAEKEAKRQKDIENLGLNSNDEGQTHSVLGDMPEDVQAGIKLRHEYPFLDDPNTPDELKVLVTDKITAYRQYAVQHMEAVQAIDDAEAMDKVYELAKAAVSSYELNQDIKAELDFYRDSEGKILGKHPKLGNLKIVQEINDMSEADLYKHRNNALKSVSKYEKAGKKDLVKTWNFRLAEAERQMKEKYNRTFEK